MTYRPQTSRAIAPRNRPVTVRESLMDLMDYAGRSPLNVYRLCNKTPTSQQAEWMAAVGKEYAKPLRKRRKRFAVRSGKGIGKTEGLGVISIWWCLRYPYSRWFQTAPTQHQITDAYVATLSDLLRGAVPTLQRFVKPSAKMVSFGGKPAREWGILTGTSIKETGMQGIHNEHLGIGIDECAGVERRVYNPMVDTLTNEDSLLMLTGNANNRDSAFYDAFYGPASELFMHFVFSSEDSTIVAKDNIRRLELEYGRESDFFRVAVLGEFPSNNPNSIMDPDAIRECMTLDRFALAADRTHFVEQYRQVGIDLARFGSDESVVAMRQGGAIVYLKAFQKIEPADTVRHAFAQQQLHGWSNEETLYVPDADGMGQGVQDMFRDATKQSVYYRSQQVAALPDYANRSTEAWFEFAKAVKARKVFLPRDPLLLKQLDTRTYQLERSTGKLQVMPKDKETQARGMSPDRADAVVLACFRQGRVVYQKASTLPPEQTRARQITRPGRSVYNR